MDPRLEERGALVGQRVRPRAEGQEMIDGDQWAPPGYGRYRFRKQLKRNNEAREKVEEQKPGQRPVLGRFDGSAERRRESGTRREQGEGQQQGQHQEQRIRDRPCPRNQTGQKQPTEHLEQQHSSTGHGGGHHGFPPGCFSGVHTLEDTVLSTCHEDGRQVEIHDQQQTRVHHQLKDHCGYGDVVFLP